MVHKSTMIAEHFTQIKFQNFEQYYIDPNLLKLEIKDTIDQTIRQMR